MPSQTVAPPLLGPSCVRRALLRGLLLWALLAPLFFLAELIEGAPGSLPAHSLVSALVAALCAALPSALLEFAAARRAQTTLARALAGCGVAFLAWIGIVIGWFQRWIHECLRSQSSFRTALEGFDPSSLAHDLGGLGTLALVIAFGAVACARLRGKGIPRQVAEGAAFALPLEILGEFDGDLLGILLVSSAVLAVIYASADRGEAWFWPPRTLWSGEEPSPL